MEILWYFAKVWFFLSPWPWPNPLKRLILLLFGAKVGKNPYSLCFLGKSVLLVQYVSYNNVATRELKEFIAHSYAERVFDIDAISDRFEKVFEQVVKSSK